MSKPGAFQRYFALIFTIVLGNLMIMVGVGMLKNNGDGAEAKYQISGIITERNIKRFFAFGLNNSESIYRVYRPSQDYEDLKTGLQVGDTVTIEVVSSTAGMQVLQVKKRNQVIVLKDLLEGQNKGGGIIAFIGGLAMIGVGIYQFITRRY